MNPKGGTEILKEQLIAQLPEQSIDGINLIGSICHPSLVKEDKINILWQHLNYDQPNVKLMQDRKFVDSMLVIGNTIDLEKFIKFQNTNPL